MRILDRILTVEDLSHKERTYHVSLIAEGSHVSDKQGHKVLQLAVIVDSPPEVILAVAFGEPPDGLWNFDREHEVLKCNNLSIVHFDLYLKHTFP